MMNGKIYLLTQFVCVQDLTNFYFLTLINCEQHNTHLGWKHIKVEYIILSQFIELSIMSHGTKYKWIICEKIQKINIACDMITLYEFHE
jgi:hypothetical protein